jgi:hypothetical protein
MDDTIFFDAISEVFDADLAGTSDGPQSSATLESALDQGDVVLGSDGSDPNSTGNRAVSDDAALGVSHRILTRASTREKWGVSLQWTVPATDGVCGFVQGFLTSGSPLCISTLTYASSTQNSYGTIITMAVSRLFIDVAAVGLTGQKAPA